MPKAGNLVVLGDFIARVGTDYADSRGVLGPHGHQEWFEEYDTAFVNLHAEKNRLRRAHLDGPTAANKAAFYQCCCHAQQRLREMQDAWMACKAEEIQGYADRNETNKAFSVIKATYGPQTKRTAPLLSCGGSALPTEMSQILKR
ncbi:hypothetical protein SprV_0200677100 [Sparganum proliferum]